MTTPQPSSSFGILSMDLLISHIFPNFSWNWLFSVARLVSKEWNEVITSPDINICIESPLIINSLTMSDERRKVFIQQCANHNFRSITGLLFKGLEISVFEDTAREAHPKFRNSKFNLFSYFPKLQRVTIESVYAYEKVLHYMAKGNLKYLKKFEIYSNRMSSRDMQEFNSFNLHVFQSLTMVRCDVDETTCLELFKNNFEHLTELNLYGNAVKQAGCQKISELNNVTTLNLCYNPIGPIGCLHLSGMRKLRKLFLKGCSIGSQGCEYLRILAEMSPLTELDVSSNEIDMHGCQHLNGFKNLTILDISNNKIGGEGLIRLFENSSLPRITDLNISRCEISDFIEKFATHAPQHLLRLNLMSNSLREITSLCQEKFASLSYLNLSVNELSLNACKDISTCKHFSKLTYLDMSFNQVHALGCHVLSQNHLSNLKTLILSHDKITGEGCKNLSNGCFKSLQTLILEGNSISDEGCQFLASGGTFPSLTQLNLSLNHITSNGCMYFKDSNTFPRLKTITLSDNEITDDGCKHLAEAEWNKSEIELILSGNHITYQGHQVLCKANYAKIYTGISTNNVTEEGRSRRFLCLQM
ncbi:hypothetical protein FDP41_004060 [Naegleria fowleri]|uniref:F-box domain-containing protein n=1 Tax=Naegleria fowleri TaxID=5763 RepID=A0A6A5BTQ6_NAEFO|nr:uncharacterized protein FDP41_004060 [Naegleria fowleri]KAF0976765.1 hypothetical protein FDP41_004060 [Naegleria fowleri]